MRAQVEEELQNAAITCQKALLTPEFKGLDAHLPDAPHDAEGWFQLLHGYGCDPEVAATLIRMKGALPDDIAAAGVNIERYAVFQALSAAASRIACERIPTTVKHFFAV
ncbi:MAG: hypothetical protein P8Y36_09315, partial [Alphaproteobacteria bacterium]